MDAGTRKRRPAFDREQGVEIAQKLFHARGYDAVGVADLTAALGIVPPSLYAAYGSKAELFDRAMRLYADKHSLPVHEILAPEKNPSDALTDLLVEAARHYSRDEACLGCMITEGMRADDPTARGMATALAEPGSEVIRDYITRHAPDDAARITDFVLLTMRGLSSFACLGQSQDRLVESARMAGRSLSLEFGERGSIAA
jgi:TetR/AcrR family transcriptional regulator, repressor for divergent bdcA